MVFKNRRQGQAAIEFLMTYGWMLLVVLIVGALIFSFVDFGSLLPNKLDLSNNLRGDPTGSLARASNGDVKVVFRYNGAKRALIGPGSAMIKTELGETCYAVLLENLNTGGNVTVDTIDTTTTPPTYTYVGSSKEIAFLNGHDGIMTYDCKADNSGIVSIGGTSYNGVHGVADGLLVGDSLIGTVSIPVKDPKTKLEIPSSGSIRLQIS